MLPGIIVESQLGLSAYGKLAKGVRVAVNTNRNRAAVAVGLTALSSQDMYMAGKRGKGVEILHCVGDYLWQLAGTKESPPDLGPPGFLVAPSLLTDGDEQPETPAEPAPDQFNKADALTNADATHSTEETQPNQGVSQ